MKHLRLLIAIALVVPLGISPAMAEGPSPDALIAKLPIALQPVFTETLGLEGKLDEAHRSGDRAAAIKAELAMMESVKRTLTKTKEFASTASDQDKEAIAKVLKFLHEKGDDNSPPPGGQPMPPGGQPMPPGRSDVSAEEDYDQYHGLFVEPIDGQPMPPGGQPMPPQRIGVVNQTTPNDSLPLPTPSTRSRRAIGGQPMPPGPRPEGDAGDEMPKDLLQAIDRMLQDVDRDIAMLKEGKMPGDDGMHGPGGQPGMGPGGQLGDAYLKDSGMGPGFQPGGQPGGQPGMGPGGQPGMVPGEHHDEGPSPEEVQKLIDQLPAQLQPVFKAVHEQMMEFDRLKMIDVGPVFQTTRSAATRSGTITSGSPDDWVTAAEKGVAANEAAIIAFEEVKVFLANASDPDQESVARFLGAIGGPPPPMPGGAPGTAMDSGPEDPAAIVDRVIAQSEEEIDRLKHALETNTPPEPEHGPMPPGSGGQHPPMGGQPMPPGGGGQHPPMGGQPMPPGDGTHPPMGGPPRPPGDGAGAPPPPRPRDGQPMPPGDGAGPQMGGGNVPPDCNDELRNSELLPQKENVTVNGKTGNGLFRTVCARQPYDTNAITLPSGRAAGAFDVEAATPGKVAFGIRVEGGADVFHSSAGKTAFHSLLIEDTTPSANGKYTIYLDAANSDPGARVTIRFLDYAK